MTKKSKLIIAGSTIIAGSVITGIAVPLSQKANEPILEEKQEEQQDDNSKKTEEKNEQAETNEQQVDSRKDSDTQKQQDEAESKSVEKTEENNKAAETNEQQADPQKANEPTLEQKQKQQDDDSKKTDENSEQVETQNNSTEEKQQNSAESKSVEKTEENNKAAKTNEQQVNSQASDTQKQQDEAKSTSGGKVEKPNNIETSEQKGTELQSKLSPVSLVFKSDKYFYLRLKTSKTLFEKIKNDRLAFTLDKGNLETDELASEGVQNGHTGYYLNYLEEGNGDVSFEITSNLSYGGKEEEKGKYKVTKVWLSNDSSKTNLLKNESNQVDVQ